MSCQFKRPFASSAKLPLPPSCPVSVPPAAYPAAGCPALGAPPPENPPPPFPRKRPFQFVVGIAIQIRTLSPAGGCVVTAVTRQTLGAAGSMTDDSIVVFGSLTDARFSHDITALTFGM